MFEEKVSSEGFQELDLVFLCDCTGSMESYIAEAQKSMKNIITTLQASEKADLHFALISYKDHSDRDKFRRTKSTDVATVFPFTDSVKEAQRYVDTMSAAGGGDIPECIACAMQEILGLEFRKSALKVVVMITDAPPHGMTPKVVDDFPKGCPAGYDPMKIARVLLEREVVCYTVGIKPAVCGNQTREWLMAIAKITGGKYVPLTGASSLPSVILFGTTEELDLKKYEQLVASEVKLVKKELGFGASEDKIDELVSKRLAEKGIEIRELEVDGVVDFPADSTIVEKIAKMTRMSQVFDLFSGGSVAERIWKELVGLFSSPRSPMPIAGHESKEDRRSMPEPIPEMALERRLLARADAPDFAKRATLSDRSGGYVYQQTSKTITASHVSKVRSKMG